MQHFAPYAALEKHAARNPETDALIVGEEKLSYGELLDRVTACANWLEHRGVVPGETVGICIRDNVGHMICATALLCMGVPQISLGSHESGKTRRKLAERVGAKKLIIENSEPWMEGLTTIVFPAGNWNEFASAPVSAANGVFAPRPLDSIAIYRNTSGSTSVPKTFPMNLARVLTTAESYARDAKDRRTLRSGSVEFDANRFGRMCSLIAGNTCIILLRMNARELVSMCERAAVSMLLLGAYRLASLLQSESDCGRLPSFTAIQTGGTRVPGRLRRKVQALLTDNLWVQYATSEIGVISTASPDQHDTFPEGVGFPDRNLFLDIVGPDGKPVEPGQIGEIRLQKEIMPAGYVAESGATDNFRFGWFYPGDLVSQEAGEPLVFHGRSDDTIMLGSLNVFPAAIEDVLGSHPDVQEAVAYPVKSRIHGEIPVAAVVLSPQAHGRDTTHLMELCRKSLGLRAPRQIVIVDRIPRNAVGKPLRKELARS